MNIEHLDPLCVDLDGTLILQDVMWVSCKNYIKTHPLKILRPLFWILKGRAYFKKQLAIHAPITPSKLKYHTYFLKFLKAYKKNGGTLILATAADERFANSVAKYLDIFDDAASVLRAFLEKKPLDLILH